MKKTHGRSEVPLITEREAVLDIYKEAGTRKWVVPTFCSENLTTTEAVLSAALDQAKKTGHPALPVTIAITNLYSHRSQTVNYTHTRNWKIGLRLFLADLHELTSEHSPFSKLAVMVHLDHIQHDLDSELLDWDMRMFSSIMFDASSVPFDDNMDATAQFVERCGHQIVIEGACDEIVDATGEERSDLTTPERAKEYL